MIHEIRTYTLTPGGVREYLSLYAEHGRDVQTRILGRLVAVLVPETGNLNQLVYHWAFDSLDERTRRRAELMADPQFTAFRQRVKELLVSQETRLFNAA